MPKGFKGNIERLTVENKYYRKALFTTKQTQLVLMSLVPYEDIGNEKHRSITQFIRVEKGSGIAVIGRKRYRLRNGDAVVIPANTWHNIIAGKRGLKIYTLYSPPAHRPHEKERVKEDED